MVVVAGIRGDDDPSGRGTTLRIFDPWPPNKGARSSVNFMQVVPAAGRAPAGCSCGTRSPEAAGHARGAMRQSPAP
jgi:hypothetical protein